MVSLPETGQQEWSDLFRATAVFQRQASWQWMSDADVFAVLSPEHAQAAYCCVLGQAGELMGLGIRLGAGISYNHNNGLYDLQAGRRESRAYRPFSICSRRWWMADRPIAKTASREFPPMWGVK